MMKTWLRIFRKPLQRRKWSQNLWPWPYYVCMNMKIMKILTDSRTQQAIFQVLPAVESQKAAVPDFGKNPGGFLPELSPKALGDLNQLFFTAYSNEIVNSGYWFDNSQLLFPSLAYPTANQAAGSQYMQNNVNLRWHFSWTWSYHQPSNRVVLLMSVMDLSQFVSSGASSGNFGFSGTLTVSAPIHAVAAPSVDLLHYSAIGQSLAKMNGAPEAEASMPEAGSLMFSSQRTGAGAGGEQLEQVQFMNKRDVDIEQQERQHDDQDDSPARPNVVDPLQYGVAAASEASMVGAMVGGDDRSSLFFNAFANYVKAYRWALKSALLFPTLQYPYNNHIHGSQTTGPNLAQTFSLSWTWAVRGADVRLTVQLAEFCQHVTADFPNGSIIERRGEKYCLDGSVTLRQWGGMVSVASANWHQQRG